LALAGDAKIWQDEGMEPVTTFDESVRRQMRRLLDDVLRSVSQRKAYFQVDEIIRNALARAPDEFPEAVFQDPSFQETIEALAADLPLKVLDARGAVTLPEMASAESVVLDRVGDTSPDLKADQEVIDKIVGKDMPTLSAEQNRALLAAALDGRRGTVIEGTAGAGKSFVMRAVRLAFERCGFDVIGVALSWNAANVLMAETQLKETSSIASLINQMDRARARGVPYFTRPTLVIVDEAGMVDTRRMYRIISEAHLAHLNDVPVKVVLTGDSLQVAPTDAGNILEAIVDRHGAVRLSEIRRQRRASQRQAVQAFMNREAGRGLTIYQHQEALRWCADANAAIDRAASEYLSFRLRHPDKTALILAIENKTVIELNSRLREAYRRLGLLGDRDFRIRVTDGNTTWDAPFAVGDEVVFRHNDRNMPICAADEGKLEDPASWRCIRKGLFNRNVGCVVDIRPAGKGSPAGSFDIVVDLQGERPGRVLVNSAKFRDPNHRAAMPMCHNYASTIYGSQGRTVDRTWLLDHRRMNFRLAYVGMSRHRDGVVVCLDEHDLHDRIDGHLNRTRRPLTSPGQAPDDAAAVHAVPIHRYTRTQMLSEVAICWAQEQNNDTLHMRDQRRRYGRNADAPGMQLRLDSHEDVQADLLSSDLEPWPLLDWSRLMDADHLDETASIRPVESLDNTRQDQPEAPVRTPTRVLEWHDVEDEPPRTQEGLLRRLGRAFSGRSASPASPRSTPLPAAHATSTTLPGHHDADAPFGTTRIEMARQAQIKTMPWLPPIPTIGHVDQDGHLDWTGIPLTPGLPPPAEIDALKGSWWSAGPHGEPRFLARNAQMEICARYRFDGTCVAGNGTPPIWLNNQARADASVPILMVPGVAEFCLMKNHLDRKFADHPERRPHLVWAARDADWLKVAKPLASRPVILVRSRHDPAQAEWAASLRDRLIREVGVTPSIRPPLVPQPSAQPAAPEAVPVRVAAHPAPPSQRRG